MAKALCTATIGLAGFIHVNDKPVMAFKETVLLVADGDGEEIYMFLPN